MKIIKREVITKEKLINVNNYIVEINNDIRETCWEFAERIILEDNPI